MCSRSVRLFHSSRVHNKAWQGCLRWATEADMYYGTQQTLQSGVCVGHDLHYGTQQRWQSCVCWTWPALWYTTKVAELCALDMTCTLVHNRRDRAVCVCWTWPALSLWQPTLHSCVRWMTRPALWYTTAVWVGRGRLTCTMVSVLSSASSILMSFSSFWPRTPAGRPSPHSRGGGLHPLLDARDTAT